MREPADLRTDRQRVYDERKQEIARVRARIADELLDSMFCERAGELDEAAASLTVAALLIDDLGALLDDWRADFPESYGERTDRVGLT